MSQNVSQTKISTDKPVVVVSQDIQSKILDQVILQSSGISLGFIIAIAGAIFLFKWTGGVTLINSFINQMEKGSESISSLANSIKSIAEKMTENHHTYIREHERILDEVKDVKDILKDDVVSILKKLDK